MKKLFASLMIMTLLAPTYTYAITPVVTTEDKVVINEIKEEVPEHIRIRDEKHEAMRQTLRDLYAERKKEDLVPDNKYKHVINFEDRFGNALWVTTPYHGSGTHIPLNVGNPYKVNILASRPNYKQVRVQVDMKTPGVTEETIILEPTEIKNVVMGNVKVPETVSYEDMKIAVYPNIENYNHSSYPLALLNVDENGNFKTYNLEDGNYQFVVHTGRYSNRYTEWYYHQGRTYLIDYGYEPVEIEVKGNVNHQFEYDTEWEEGFGTMQLAELFFNTDTAYTPECTDLINDYNRMSDELKAEVDARKWSLGSEKVILEILDFVRGRFGKKPEHLGPYTTRDLSSMSEIEELNEGFLDNCGEYAVFFIAVASHLGMPTNVIYSSTVEWMEERNFDITSGHNFAEVYIADEWVLVDPTGALWSAKYDRDNFTIISQERTYYVTYRGAIPPSYISRRYPAAPKHASVDLAKNFDLSVVDRGTPNVTNLRR